MPKLLSRRLAKAYGLPRYCTGAPCKNGHFAERYTSSRVCCECHERPIPEREILRARRLEEAKAFANQMRKYKTPARLRRDAVSMMALYLLPLPHDCLERVLALALDMATLRCPHLSMSDISRGADRLQPEMWKVRCFPADIEFIRWFVQQESEA